MADRRQGPTWAWNFFMKFLFGERRSGKERRISVESILNMGCAGDCRQGRRPCTCKPER